jgi:tetratricopeptide (TPR) repeat protein
MSNSVGGPRFDDFAPRTPNIIGRDDQIQLIAQTVEDEKTSYVIHIVGPGGIGKTRLLEELEVILQKLDGASFLWSNIVDLYHSEYHTPLGVQEALVLALDPAQQFFTVYRQRHQELKEKQAVGWSGEELDKIRSELDKLFLEEYRELAAQRRIVLSFDTVELLQYEVDAVQKVCDVPNVETVIKNWLVRYIPQLPNTVTLFAGRPQPEIKREFQDVFGELGERFITIELDVLSEPEMRRYLATLGEMNEKLAEGLEPVMVEKIISLARGRAIYLALLVDLFLNGGSSIAALYDESEQGGSDDKRVGKLLVEHLRRLPNPLALMVDYLAHARKGLDKALLRSLSGWSGEEIEAIFAQMRRLAIVKTHRQADQLFFHDQVYDLYDLYFLTASPRNTALYADIAGYYEGKTDEASKIARLYYELQKEPNEGYHHFYARWDEEAIKSNESDFDMRLRDQVLHFHNRYVFRPESEFYDPRIADTVDQPAIHRDCAVRWVKRRLARGKNDEALAIAERIRYNDRPLFNWNTVNDPLYKAGLLTAWAEPMLYTNQPAEKVREVLTEAIEWLDDFQPQDDNQQWWRNRILGRAHNNLGYLYWATGQFHEALRQFRLALPKFSEATIEDEQADTLNNLAFLMALLGRPSLAHNHLDHALKIRKRLGHPIPLAFSYMTRSYIFVLEGRPVSGERDGQTALEMFDGYGYQRGIGMAFNGLGFAARKHGNQWKDGVYTAEEAQVYFQQAIDYYDKARSIFPEKIKEPLRLWEACNESGSTYCDWGWLLLNQPALGDDEAVRAKYEDSIRFQEMAVAIAEETGLSFQEIDSYDDLAQIYSDMGFLLIRMGQQEEGERYQAQAAACLEKIEQELIPLIYRLQPGKGFSGSLEEGDAYWLALGKLYYWRGIWGFRQIEYKQVQKGQLEAKKREATQQLITSCIYYHRFWPTSQGLERAADRLCRNLQAIHASPAWAHERVQEMAKTYQVDLSLVERAIDDILGIEG